MSNLKENFGDRVKKTREARGITASELSRLTDVTPTAVWNWENKHRIPQAKTLGPLATVLNVSKDWLLSGEGNATPSPLVTAPTIDLSAFPLEELMSAIDRKGFTVSVTPKVG